MKTRRAMHITADAVEKKLVGFVGPLAHGWTYEKLASRVQEAFESTLTESGNDPARPSNATLRKNFKKIRDAALKLRESIDCLDDDSISTSIHPNNHTNYIGYIMQAIPKSVNFLPAAKRAATDAQTLMDFADAVIAGLKSQKGRWKQSEEKIIRVERGAALIPIYVEAFDDAAKINNWNSGDNRHQNPTNFMRFYQVMVELGFGETATHNLTEILTEARDLRKSVGP